MRVSRVGGPEELRRRQATQTVRTRLRPPSILHLVNNTNARDALPCCKRCLTLERDYLWQRWLRLRDI